MDKFYFISCWVIDIEVSGTRGGSRISEGKAPTLQAAGGGGGAPIYNFTNISKKLHEIEKFLVHGKGGGGGRSGDPLGSALGAVQYRSINS